VLNKEITELKQELIQRDGIVEEKEAAHRDIMKDLQAKTEDLSICQTNLKRTKKALEKTEKAYQDF